MSHTYLRFPPAPSLPLAPQDWGTRFQDQYSNVLRLYFNQISTGLQQLSGTHGGRRLSFPHGAFYDTTTQTAASTTVAYVVGINSTSHGSGVRVQDGSKITVEHEGVYNLQYSLQLDNSSNAPQDVDVWIRHNGNDVSNSNSRFGLPARKSIGDPFHMIAALNFMYSLNSGDYLQLAWSTTSTDVSIRYYGTPTSPTRPEIPSGIFTMTFVSALG